MKNLFTIKAASGLVLLASLGFGGYYMFKHGYISFHIPPAEAALESAHKKGSVEGVSFSKIDNDLQGCYESYLTREPKTDDGQILFHFMLSKSGEVNFLEMIQSDFEEDQFVKCVTEKVRVMKTNVSSDRIGVMIAHRFKFHRKDRTKFSFEE